MVADDVGRGGDGVEAAEVGLVEYGRELLPVTKRLLAERSALSSSAVAAAR